MKTRQATLYLMLGYPGAGKTTTAKVLHDLTGAIHLWADEERRRKFDHPTYTHQENLELYADLNEKAAELLRKGHSVIFDTNFNFYKDREKLRRIASEAGAVTRLIWVITPKDLAKRRATTDAHMQDTRVLGDMPPERFDRMANNLQPPKDDEPYLKVDGTRVTSKYMASLLADQNKP